MNKPIDFTSVPLGYNALPRMQHVGWAPEPNCGRGSASIIWSCVTVMAFATCSTIHLNTRTLRSSLWYTSLFQTGAYYFWWPWRKVLRRKTDKYINTEFPGFLPRKALLAIITLLFPEVGVCFAVEEFVIAWYIRRNTRKLPGWEKFTLQQAFLVLMGGLSLPELDRPEDFDQLVAMNANTLHFSVFPSPDQISLRAKKDYTDKIIALSQGVYFVSNFTTRWIKRYGLSLLELVTLNYLVFAIIMFLLRYQKPQELQEPFELDYLEELEPLSDLEDSAYQEWYAEQKAGIFLFLFCVLVLASALTFVFPYSTRTLKSVLMQSLGFAAILLIPANRILIELCKEYEIGRREGSKFVIFTSVTRKTIPWIGSVSCTIGSLYYMYTRVALLRWAFERMGDATAGIYATPASWTRYLGHIGA